MITSKINHIYYLCIIFIHFHIVIAFKMIDYFIIIHKNNKASAFCLAPSH